MPLDPRVEEAVREAVAECNQPTGLAGKIMAWLEALAEGNEDFEDRDRVARYLEVLYEATEVTLDEEETREAEAEWE